MAMKARWLARRLRQVAGAVLVALDEPYLYSFGSAFVNVSRGDVIAAIDGGVAAIQQEGALAGLHCCGNTDWSLVLATGVDVINFDAWEFAQGLSLYPAELISFLERGGTLSWGIVPASRTSEDLDPRALLSALTERVERAIDALVELSGLVREREGAR
jgi:hypothetical protein